MLSGLEVSLASDVTTEQSEGIELRFLNSFLEFVSYAPAARYPLCTFKVVGVAAEGTGRCEPGKTGSNPSAPCVCHSHPLWNC